MCYKNKSLIEYQDIDDCLSSKGEKEWLLYLEKLCLDTKIQRQKFIPLKNIYNKETKQLECIEIDETEINNNFLVKTFHYDLSDLN